jgi:CTP:phosphocholine cytidylyltransferase-like protein
MKNEIAILMAAGLGSRMLPLTEKVPKPLIKVFGKSMIETIIDALEVRGVKHIYIVVGYKKEQFEFLQSKYSNVTLIENQEYTIKNNISSIYAVADIIGKENCFICEADLYVADPSILEAVLINSCYYGKMVQGWSDDWGFDLDKSGRIVRVGKGVESTYNMVSISYFTAEDAKKLSEAIKNAYTKKGHENLFWDEVVDKELENIRLTIHPINEGQIYELDSVSDLMRVDENYGKYN